MPAPVCVAVYRRQRPVDQEVLDRRRIVHPAARLAIPVPSEHPALLRFLTTRIGSTST